MKFLYADSLDYVDPTYDFKRDRSLSGRKAQQDDEYPHEFLDPSPYDGILVSRAIVGDRLRTGKYTESQAMRFRREGGRAFLRYPTSRFPGSILMGDCGAFSYRNEVKPPYSVEDTLEFYADAGFSHGCSVDHIVFDFLVDDAAPTEAAKQRTEITLDLANEFIKKAPMIGPHFTPLGVVQGWSPKSMADSAVKLARMGYDYIAVGGMVPLAMAEIHLALAAITDALKGKPIGLHLLGFGKAEELDQLTGYPIASFDTTSPLLRAFKDAKRNYYVLQAGGGLDYYTAVRVPQALENPKIMRSVREGRLDQEKLVRMEADALAAVRAFSERSASLEDAVDRVVEYETYTLVEDNSLDAKSRRKAEKMRAPYRRSLGDRPWESCSCRACREAGVETMLFRSSNRNKRRGIHNLAVFRAHMNTLGDAA